jgi:hypothetical protein
VCNFGRHVLASGSFGWAARGEFRAGLQMICASPSSHNHNSLFKSHNHNSLFKFGTDLPASLPLFSPPRLYFPDTRRSHAARRSPLSLFPLWLWRRPFCSCSCSCLAPRASHPSPLPPRPSDLGPQAVARGRQNKKIGDPRGGWVGQRPKKDHGQIFFRFFFFNLVVLNSLTEKRPKTY